MSEVLSSGSIRTAVLLTLSSVNCMLLFHRWMFRTDRGGCAWKRKDVLLPLLGSLGFFGFAAFLNVPFKLDDSGIASIRALQAEMEKDEQGIGSLALGSGSPFVWHYWTVQVSTFKHTFWQIKKRQVALNLFVIATSTIALFGFLHESKTLTLTKLLFVQFILAICAYLYFRIDTDHRRAVTTVMLAAPLVVYLTHSLRKNSQNNRVHRSTRLYGN